MEELIRYTLSFLLRDDPFYMEQVGYTADEAEWPHYKLVVRPSAFWDDYGTAGSLPPAHPVFLDGMPVPYGEKRMARYAHAQGETLIVYADFVASAYFLMSRYEEWLRPTVRDAHGRFPGRESWAARAGVLDRPLVDEYGLWLKARIDERMAETAPGNTARLTTDPADAWRPGLKRIYLTHDVDAPFLYQSAKGRIRSLLDGRGIRKTFPHCFGQKTTDPYDTFTTIGALDNSLKNALNNNSETSVVQDIYFIKSLGDNHYDKPRYRLGTRALRRLRDRLLRQGAAIGLHVSYTAGGRPDRIGREKHHLEKNWGLDVRYSRHHFLRFTEPFHADVLAKNGLTDDFTMGFADTAGFRLGTARPVRAIDPAARRLTGVTYHPLLCMENTLFNPAYMNLDEAQARETLFRLIDRAHAVGGEACLLWHNTSFMQAAANAPAIPGIPAGRIAYDTPLRLYAEACTYIARLQNTAYKPHLRILLVCDLFPPAFAPRMGYLTRYLQAFGHEVTVVTETNFDDGAFAFLRTSTEVHEQAFPDFLKAHFGRHRKTRVLYRMAADLCEERPFDLLLSSAYRTFPIPVAARIARRYGLPWVADHRDIIEQYPDCGFIARPLPRLCGLEQIFGRLWGVSQIQKRNRLLRQSDAVTTVSPWHTDLFGHAIAKPENVVLIANGYDPALYRFKPQPTDTFHIVYTGRILSLRQMDPSLLFETVAKGRREQTEWGKAVRIVFYCDARSRRLLDGLANRMFPDLLSDGILQLHDYIPSDAVPDVLNRASVLLVLNNRPPQSDRTADRRTPKRLYRPWRWFFQKAADRCPQGILTTKLFEALGVEKPILCLRDDGPIADLLRESGQGCAASTTEEVEAFLKKAHEQWQSQGYTHIAGNPEVRTRYRRDYQARQFEQLFFNVLNMPFPMAPMETMDQTAPAVAPSPPSDTFTNNKN